MAANRPALKPVLEETMKTRVPWFDEGLFIGFDAGGTHTRGCLIRFENDVPTRLASRRVAIPQPATPEAVLTALSGLADQLLSACEHSRGDLNGVGVGLAGQLDRRGQVVLNGPNLGWRDVPFGRMLTKAFRAPSILVNDLTAIAEGERVFGALKGVEHAFVVFVGTGIGSALLLDGRIYPGFGNNAGEFGHIKVVPDGRACGCGQRGCLEAYAGGRHLEERIAAAIADGKCSGLKAFLKGERRVRASVVDRASAGGHPWARAFWDEVADALSLALANVATLLNPQVLLLGGGVLRHCPRLLEQVSARIPELVLAVARADLEVSVTELWDEAGVLGAAAIAARSSGMGAGEMVE